MYRDEPILLLQFVAKHFAVETALCLFLGFAAIVLAAFLALHVWNISAGITSSERQRIAGLQKAVRAAQVTNLALPMAIDACAAVLIKITRCSGFLRKLLFQLSNLPTCGVQNAKFSLPSLVQTEDAKRAPADHDKHETASDWSQVRRMLPQYSHGFWANWHEVLQPDCIRFVDTANDKKVQ
jgi:hypothetical protein